MDGLINLQNLDLQSNILSSIESIEELKNLPKLQVLDLKNNIIDEKDRLIPFFS
jgi:Leucine-rich repeat (LRR) protein